MKSVIGIITSIILICVFTLFYIIADHANETSGVSVPLRYDPEYGIYTAKLGVGNRPVQIADAVVDTGSAVMVLVADKTYCPSCATSLTQGAIDPLRINTSTTHKEIKIDYGSADDTVVEYLAPIQFTDNNANSLSMKVYVLKESSQPTSILGMIPHNLRSDPIKSKPFLSKLMESFTQYSDITFVLCGDKGNSYFRVGPTKLPAPLVKTKLLNSEFYEIYTLGLYNEANQSIVKPVHRYGMAILDTGTGGFIILAEHLYTPLYDYLYQHAGVNNRKLDPNFWQKNYCIPRSEVDFTSFPTVKIGLVSQDDHPYYLNIPPSAYINRAGCDENQVRLIFNRAEPPHFFTALRNHKARKKAGSKPDMVIGTGLLNEYAIKIDYKLQPSVTFFDNKTLCTPATGINNN